MRIADAKKIGFNELAISNFFLKKSGKSTISLIGGVLRKENSNLFKKWVASNNKQLY